MQPICAEMQGEVRVYADAAVCNYEKQNRLEAQEFVECLRRRNLDN